jgi:hypothetical protein
MSKLVVVAVPPEKWQKIVDYIMNTPVLPAYAHKVVELIPLLGSSPTVEIDLDKNE